ncbi:MAG: flavin reductase family protein [Clostridiales bacterium]|nr:flavin reductase family protein [Clostridiales bacterium]
MKNINSKNERISFPPATMLYPLPVVMVSCAGTHPETEEERPNIITIAWAGTVCSDPPMLSISVRKSRHSHGLIASTQEFVVNLVDENLVKACDYCGVRSGSSEDKFASVRLSAVPANGLNHAPAIKQSLLHLSCIVKKVVELGSHDLFIAEIVSMSVDKSLLNEKGKICLEHANLITYVHGDYFNLGEMLGFFGYSVASKKKLKSRMKKSNSNGNKAKSKPRQKRKPREL